MEGLNALLKNINQYGRQFCALFFLLLIDFAAIAQRVRGEGDEDNSNKATTEFNYDTRETAWYLQPWIWAIVAAVLILVIAYAAKGNIKKNIESDSERGTTHSS